MAMGMRARSRQIVGRNPSILLWLVWAPCPAQMPSQLEMGAEDSTPTATAKMIPDMELRPGARSLDLESLSPLSPSAGVVGLAVRVPAAPPRLHTFHRSPFILPSTMHNSPTLRPPHTLPRRDCQKAIDATVSGRGLSADDARFRARSDAHSASCALGLQPCAGGMPPPLAQK
jgi:hypothetical protein